MFTKCMESVYVKVPLRSTKETTPIITNAVN